jgi:hypothetical protein
VLRARLHQPISSWSTPDKSGYRTAEPKRFPFGMNSPDRSCYAGTESFWALLSVNMELYTRPRKTICALSAVLVFAFLPVNKANGQTAESLSQVKTVFVDSLGTEEGATELRDAMIKALRKCSDIQVVATANEADAVIRGSGKIWETGSMRVGPRGGFSEKTYDGYLQVELMGKGNKTLWSFRATPSKFPWNGIIWDLASHVVKSLMESLRQVRKAGS